MPPQILALLPIVLAALMTACGIAMIAGPLVLPLWAAHMDEADRRRIVAAVKGANDALGPFIRATPTDIDNRILEVSEMVVRELGKVATRNPVKVQGIAKAVVGKSAVRAVSAAGSSVGVR
jgi:hypothetical protein